MGLFDRLRKVTDPAKLIVDATMGVADRAAAIVDRFVQNPDERHQAQMDIERLKLDAEKQAMVASNAILADRQSAREMAGTHGKLQTRFSMTFLVAFMVILFGEFALVGLIVSWEMKGVAPLSGWSQALISGMLTGVLAYMVSMLKEVVGFLFGGSAGGDDREARLTETLRNAGGQNDE